MQRSHLRTFAALAFTRRGSSGLAIRLLEPEVTPEFGEIERCAWNALLLVFHLLEQVVDSGTSAGGAHRLARGHSVEGRKGMIGPVGIVAALEFEQRLFGN